MLRKFDFSLRIIIIQMQTNSQNNQMQSSSCNSTFRFSRNLMPEQVSIMIQQINKSFFTKEINQHFLDNLSSEHSQNKFKSGSLSNPLLTTPTENVIEALLDVYNVILLFLFNKDESRFFISRDKMKKYVDFDFKKFRYVFTEIASQQQEQNSQIDNKFNILLEKPKQDKETKIKKCASYLVLLKELLFNLKGPNICLEKREIFYNNIHHFKNINSLHSSIQELCFCLRISRSCLKITSSPKGLVYGIDFDNRADSCNPYSTERRNKPVFSQIGQNRQKINFTVSESVSQQSDFETERWMITEQQLLTQKRSR